jgi:hypothetical protein
MVLEKLWCLVQIRYKNVFCWVILIAGFGCMAPKEKGRPVVFSLQQIGKLATAEYQITRIVKAEDNQTWYKWGDRKILISCTASVKAGIDFAALQPQHINEQEGKIFVQLPPPQILSLNIPPEAIKVAYTDVGVFRDPFSSSEINAIMQTAERQMQRQITSLDILTNARTNAIAFVTRFLSNAGFNEVYVSFQ